eukprot:TRINITY_DN566_c0_g1_i3.p1 TRINITY_DN566_c0_g1~~TRINITY_DN566_c0_g1_i3.p1  ORF type:complete len:114 (+),score=9.39 TRINITY_DN566_c0_g1_i3:376-717(+)
MKLPSKNKKMFHLVLLSSVFFSVSSAANESLSCLSNDEAKKILTPFYDFLSHKSTAENALDSFDENYKGYIGFGQGEVYSREETINFLNAELVTPVPDLTWEIKRLSLVKIAK